MARGILIILILAMSVCSTAQESMPDVSPTKDKDVRQTQRNEAEINDNIANNTKALEAALETWLGSTEEALVAKLGRPQDIYEIAEGKKLLTYLYFTDEGISRVYFTVINGKVAYWGHDKI